MYCGRIVVVGMSPDSRPFVGYRISSRSFPNREIQAAEGSARVVPRPGFEADLTKNPFISYRCLKVVGSVVVATNGSQTEPIATKVERGMPPKDAIGLGLLLCDYEGDDYDTPRLAGAVEAESGYLGIVTRDALEVARFALRPGRCRVVATNELNHLSGEEFELAAEGAVSAASFLLDGGVFREMTHPVGAIAWMGGQVAVASAP